MWLDTTTRKLQILLKAAATTNNCPVVVSYEDHTSSSNPTLGASVSNTSGVSAVDILAAPAASTWRKVKYISVQNADTVITNATIRYNDNATTYVIINTAIPIDSSLCYTPQLGWYVTTANSSTILNAGANIYTLPRGAGSTISTGTMASVMLFAGSISTVDTPCYYTPSINCKTIKLYVQASGGGGGGAARATSAPGMGGGGSAGGYLEKTIAVTANSQYVITIGKAGAGGAAGNNNGTAASNTTVVIGGTTYTASGGLGGIGMASSGVPGNSALGGASPAVSTNGDVNCGGMPGSPGIVHGTTTGIGGLGGSSKFGEGANASTTDATGNAASIGFGGGGGGACAIAANRAGGSGAIGCVLIEEYR